MGLFKSGLSEAAEKEAVKNYIREREKAQEWNMFRFKPSMSFEEILEENNLSPRRFKSKEELLEAYLPKDAKIGQLFIPGQLHGFREFSDNEIWCSYNRANHQFYVLPCADADGMQEYAAVCDRIFDGIEKRLGETLRPSKTIFTRNGSEVAWLKARKFLRADIVTKYANGTIHAVMIFSFDRMWCDRESGLINNEMGRLQFIHYEEEAVLRNEAGDSRPHDIGHLNFDRAGSFRMHYPDTPADNFHGEIMDNARAVNTWGVKPIEWFFGKTDEEIEAEIEEYCKLSDHLYGQRYNV